MNKPRGPNADAAREVISGLVERVTFHSTETGFCVLRVKARGHRDLVTTIGYTALLAEVPKVTPSAETSY